MDILKSNVCSAVVTLKKGEGRTLKAGGSWIYDNEIAGVEGDFQDGNVLRVEDFDGYPMGWGFINTKSKIEIRMLTRDANVEMNDDFLYNRVKNAWEYRKAVIDTSSCRVIFGEADFLPGLVIDKYEDVLVVESLALGIDILKEKIIEILKEILLEDGIKIRGVYERSDAKVRLKEGMERCKGFIGEEFDTAVQITENGVKFNVDIVNGQKTGFFLDQKGNRMAVQELCQRLSQDGTKPLSVLDCFTHTGSFALNAAIGGASNVEAVDVSDLAIEEAKRNAELNNVMDRMTFTCDDVLDLLPRYVEEGKHYDFVILDPPAFTKSRETIKKAAKGYREINIRGLKLVKSGGYFATCSCSHFMDQELFSEVIAQAAKSAHKKLRQIEFRTQAKDHPILWAGDEVSYYLKFLIFQVLDER
ncbi:23S rRNA (cytosine1962-C5)-methyltransferase [Lachnospiraceae bacterium NE2001]|nr:23S rRNA (cytosine1962-C5)-methyltransferase [Lachnospiraceae bacterium NE2001]